MKIEGDMGQFQGFIELGDTLNGAHLVKNSSGVPQNADALPTFRVYGASQGPMANGTGTAALKDTGGVTDATNASPIVIASVGHGITTGTRVNISGVGGNTAANGAFSATKVDADHFSLDGSTGNAGYTSGGTWNVAGLYGFSLSVTANDGYQKGETYSVLVSAALSGASQGDVHTFTVT